MKFSLSRNARTANKLMTSATMYAEIVSFFCTHTKCMNTINNREFQ